MKKILYGTEARDKLLAGAEKVYKAVSSTLGPKGSNVAIGREWSEPVVFHDGVSVSRECVGLEDKFENLGAELIKSAADKMDTVGDGTTLTTILTYAIAKEANKNIVAGANARMLRKGIEIAVDKIVETVDKLSIPIKDENILQVATISAQDEEIGSLIAGAIKKLGRDAVITVEESGSTDMSIDYKEGMAFDKGWQNKYFITNNETGEAEIENPYILITDARISDMKEFMSIFAAYDAGLKANLIENTSLVIISNGVDGAPLATLISNKVNGGLKPLCIQAPGFGIQQLDFLQDIAIATGATMISKDLGIKLNEFKIEYFGRAKKIVSTKDSTTIIGGAGDDKELKERVKLIKNQLANEDREFDRERLQERLAKLTSGIAIINVGASSDAEVREKKEACIDAISAVKAACEDGIVPGGETTLIRCINKVPHGLDGDIAIGASIIVKACQKPFEVLMENSGYNSGQMLERLRAFWFDCTKDENWGIDVMDGEAKDMVKSGIVDPTKVVKSALRNAASSAIMIATTSTIIIEENVPTD
jgi:chaperonin GroEL